MPPRLKRTTCLAESMLGQFLNPVPPRRKRQRGRRDGAPKPPPAAALHQLHLGRTGPIGPERRQYDLLNPRCGIMMRLMQSMAPTQEPPRSSFSCLRWAWRRPSEPTAPRSGNMSFSHHPTRRINSIPVAASFLSLQSKRVYISKFSQKERRFISKSFGKK
jgi:hypothetical protein